MALTTLSLIVPTALVPVVWPHPSSWNWQFQKADGPRAMLPYQSSFWGGGEQRQEMFLCAGIWQRTQPGHKKGLFCPDLWALHLLVLPVLHQAPWQGRPQTFTTLALFQLLPPCSGACWEACLARCLLSFTKAWASRSPFLLSNSLKIGSPVERKVRGSNSGLRNNTVLFLCQP